jgi:hypothetical protein
MGPKPTGTAYWPLRGGSDEHFPFKSSGFLSFNTRKQNERKIALKLKQLTAEQRRIAIDAIQLYQNFLELREERKAYRGGLL